MGGKILHVNSSQESPYQERPVTPAVDVDLRLQEVSESTGMDFQDAQDQDFFKKRVETVEI